jgi:hypothetical protein
MTPPKIIVRYFIGSSGRFISSLLQSLIEPLELVESHRAHLNFEHYRCHTYTRPGRDMSVYDTFTTKLDQTEEELELGAQYFRDSISWDLDYVTQKPPPMYILSCHAYNPEPMLRGIENSRVVNITFELADLDQISYNFITKNVIEDHNHQDLIDMIRFLQYKWPKGLPPPDIDQIDWTDARQLSYINKWLNIHTSYLFNSVSKKMAQDPRAFNIKFSDIANKKLTTQLPDLIKFIGIDVTQERIQNATALINQYADAQTPVPWSLEFQDYKK